MKVSPPVFLDANALLYTLDETSLLRAEAVALIQGLLNNDAVICTSHHVIEEVLHIVQRISQSGVTATQVVAQIERIPGLVLIEPSAALDFAKRYAAASDRLKMGVNDALLLQLMLDAGIDRLFSYDKKFVKKAKTLGIQNIVPVATPSSPKV